MTRKQNRATIVRFELMSIPGSCWTITDYMTGKVTTHESYNSAVQVFRELKKGN